MNMCAWFISDHEDFFVNLRDHRFTCCRPCGPGFRVSRPARHSTIHHLPGSSFRDRTPRARCLRPGCSCSVFCPCPCHGVCDSHCDGLCRSPCHSACSSPCSSLSSSYFRSHCSLCSLFLPAALGGCRRRRQRWYPSSPHHSAQ
jgi:hypothetical protein